MRKLKIGRAESMSMIAGVQSAMMMNSLIELLPVVRAKNSKIG